MKKSTSYLYCLSLASTLLFVGCVQSDSTGDTTQQEINRQSAAADSVAAQYAPIKGQYLGVFNNSRVLLNLDVARQNSSGGGDSNLAPQPTLIGNLVFTPKIFVSNQEQPLTIPFAVSSGQFTGNSDLSLTVQENGNPTILHCSLPSLNELDCSWNVAAGSSNVPKFTLNRMTTAQASSLQSEDFGGTYIGSNSDYKEIKAQFETLLSPQAGAYGLPQISIAGSFSFNGVSFSFKDSEYDPISNKLAIVINGDNPIVVNCTLENTSTLHCTWFGTHGSTAYESFDLTQAK